MSIGWYATYNDFGATWGKKIGAVGIAIYQALASRAWEGQCFPSYQTIAEDTGVSRPTAIKYIKILQDAGLIEVQPRHNRRGDPTSNLYTLPDLPLLNKKRAQAASQPAKPIDTSGMSEAEIAESVRKSHFVSRPKKKAVTPESVPDAAPATSEISPPNSPITKAVEAVNSEPVVTPVVQSQIQPPPATVVPAPTPSAPAPSVRSVQQEKPLNFGLLSDKSDQVAALHLLKTVPNKQEVLDELNKAIREKRIQTTAIQYLGGLVKKVAQGEFVPSANKKTEDELFIEKKQRAAEQNRTAKQAIADCKYCNDSGYLVFSTISPFKPQSIVCTHNEKSAEMVRKLTEQEDDGQVITYFGKQGKDRMLDMGGSVMQVIREVLSPVSKTTTQSTDSTTSSHAAAPTQPSAQHFTAPVPEPVHKSPPVQPITSNVPETQSESKAESVPSQTSETPSNKEGGFKTIMQVVEEALAEKARRDAEKQAREQPQKLEEPEEPETPEEKLETFLSDLLSESDIHDDDDEDILEISKEISTTETSTAPQYPSSIRGKPIREKIVQKIAAVNADIERFYGTIEIILNADVIRYLKLQILVRLARSRALLEREAEKIGERNYKATAELLERIDKSYKKLRTSVSLRKVFQSVNSIIQLLQPMRPDDPQRLLDAKQERAVIRRSLHDTLKRKAEWAEAERTGKTEHEREVARNYRIQRGRLAWALLLEEQQPTLPFEELHELIPKEYQYPPDKLQQVLAMKAEREAAEKEERERRTPEAELIEAQALELTAKTNKP
ncbi:MAG: helix-turn-helix domain-containing protein [Thiotrichaceae bacterium]